MPIKFRCQHCDHLLGISRKKAGEQVDCPACGRAIRVPDLDGQTRPVLEPQLQSNDPQLLQAFRELDELDKEPLQLTFEPKVRVSGIMLNPLPQHKPQEIAITPTNLPDQEEVVDNIDPLEVLKPILLSPPIQKHLPRKESFNTAAWYSLTFVLVLVSFVAGYFIGLRFPLIEQPGIARDQTENKAAVVAPATEVPGIFVIKGRIAYKQPTGEERPDRGARIFLLPQSYAGVNKLPALGFRSGDTSTDFDTARLALEKLGGTAAIVKDDGKYEITAKVPGDYSLVIVSRFAEQEDQEILGALVIPIMKGFFEKPLELLGKVGCHAHTLSLKDKGNIEWDYVFAP